MATQLHLILEEAEKILLGTSGTRFDGVTGDDPLTQSPSLFDFRTLPETVAHRGFHVTVPEAGAAGGQIGSAGVIKETAEIQVWVMWTLREASSYASDAQSLRELWKLLDRIEQAFLYDYSSNGVFGGNAAFRKVTQRVEPHGEHKLVALVALAVSFEKDLSSVA